MSGEKPEEKRPGRGTVEELVWVLGHLINLEEHKWEMGEVEEATAIKEVRRDFVAQLAKELKWACKWKPQWCVLKHLSSLIVHVEEAGTSGDLSPETVEKLQALYKTAWVAIETLLEEWGSLGFAAEETDRLRETVTQALKEKGIDAAKLIREDRDSR
ncbi:hypothetical protein [Thermofilum pendens]|nr:hypothetical protein [Thermofilum pendens]